ncbi:MAG: hypothetical protein AAGD09_25630 [Cyanobacteria bacterium P01_F01_bin.56]
MLDFEDNRFCLLPFALRPSLSHYPDRITDRYDFAGRAEKLDGYIETVAEHILHQRFKSASTF